MAAATCSTVDLYRNLNFFNFTFFNRMAAATCSTVDPRHLKISNVDSPEMKLLPVELSSSIDVLLKWAGIYHFCVFLRICHFLRISPYFSVFAYFCVFLRIYLFLRISPYLPFFAYLPFFTVGSIEADCLEMAVRHPPPPQWGQLILICKCFKYLQKHIFRF